LTFLGQDWKFEKVCRLSPESAVLSRIAFDICIVRRHDFQ
jgi:hypothetical protein